MSSNTTPPSDWNSPDGDSPYQPTSPSSQSYPQSYEPTSHYGSVDSSPSPYDDDKKGFFGSLFDMSFDYYVTPKIAKFVYILAIICAAVMWLGMIAGCLGGGDSGGKGLLAVLAILLGWIPAFLFIIGVRMQIEFIIALIKTSENTSILRKRLTR